MPLKEFGRLKFDFATMEAFANKGVSDRFKAALVDGAKTTDEDAAALEKALYAWCAANDCMNYAHWCVTKTASVCAFCCP